MNPVIMDSAGMHRTVIRLSHEIEERNEGLHGVVLVGVKRGGEILANRICAYFKKAEGASVPCAGWHTYIKTFEKAEMLSGFTALIFTRIYPGIAVRSIIPTKMSVVKKACIRKFILPVRPFSFCANVCACPRTP